MGRAYFAGLLLLGTMHSPASAQEAVVLKPSSNWNLNYGPTRCRISRTFGEGSQMTAFYFEQYGPSDQLSWLVAGPLVKRLSGLRHAKVTFGPGVAPFEMDEPSVLKLGSFGDAASGIGLPSESTEEHGAEPTSPIGLPHLAVEQGKGIEWIEFARGKAAYRLETGNLGPVFAAMNTCMDDLVKSWGADPAILRERQTGPKVLNMPEIVRKLHYPGAPLSAGKEAVLNIRVMVEADGSMSKCAISQMTEAAEFDNEACLVFMRIAKFEPARDAQGRPIPSYYVNRIRYSIS